MKGPSSPLIRKILNDPIKGQELSQLVLQGGGKFEFEGKTYSIVRSRFKGYPITNIVREGNWFHRIIRKIKEFRSRYTISIGD